MVFLYRTKRPFYTRIQRKWVASLSRVGELHLPSNGDLLTPDSHIRCLGGGIWQSRRSKWATNSQGEDYPKMVLSVSYGQKLPKFLKYFFEERQAGSGNNQNNQKNQKKTDDAQAQVSRNQTCNRHTTSTFHTSTIPDLPKSHMACHDPHNPGNRDEALNRNQADT